MTNIITKAYIMVQLRSEQFLKDQRGVTAIEYALIGVAMATLLAAIFGNQNSGFLGAINTAFTKIVSSITSVTTGNGK
ncbi:Flp pilus assembly protein, pilin Flp [Serratia fonticola]|jgi:pilus assembly protein Flp/PilA|uniref:Flp pilus assembly protein, pilin Flp n=1 Tax=Serratia fonticola TaxID=47917 RepID=A0A0F7H8G8_SERFO|nr:MULTISPECIES: Flp family type IVb pilin [Serratia]AKG68213.1 pilus assembly protein PilA [Serratia fonticola]AYM91964.1 Flp family type IVb pilin [Serratia sp. 3ACOL1]CAI1952190.1 Flp pilus assembly protein, pilin Flp [Serratia fonticola]VTR56600.1 Flp pilus assembly protein, pilin Flp [Serratia fonticola]